MIMIDIEMPQCCADCFALDESGDYPFCRISHEQRGYTFDVGQNRMPSCPLEEPEEPFEEVLRKVHQNNMEATPWQE